jgi:UDP-2,3-diacylglucosamine hydrolase
MRRLVVSDFHLDPSEPARYRAAMDAIAHCPSDQLILAGDIFEAWVGDDGATDADDQFLEFCGKHSDDTLFIHGNRDFLISENYLHQFDIQLIDRYVDDELIVIHGDELCTLDHAYQTFKQEVRQASWMNEFLAKPLSERQAIADGLRQASRETQANRAEAIGDAVNSEINRWMADYEAKLLVHGHTHRPAVQLTAVGLRAVTSDWNDSGIGVFIDTTDSEQIVSLAHLSPNGSVIREQWLRQAGTPEWKRNSESGL